MWKIERNLRRLPKDSSSHKEGNNNFSLHYPVMYREVIKYLKIKQCKVVVDCTVGVASHALKFFSIMCTDSILVGIDKDEQSLEVAEERLSKYRERVHLVKDDFKNVDRVLSKLKIDKPDVFFFDLGISRYQLLDSQRGFSFSQEGPLDMRMDTRAFLCAFDLVNNLSEEELAKIFKKFGEERFSRRIAHRLVKERQRHPIMTTLELSSVVSSVFPKRYHFRIHPATKVFQALRIAVNRELDSLKEGLNKAINLLSSGGRIGVISFHSLEDRIVKQTFRECSLRNQLKIITKKPLTPTEEEVRENSSSRSAKLRITERI